MDTVKYLHLKQQQRLDAEKKVRRGQDAILSKLDNQPSVGLGHGYAVDMTDAMRQVNNFDYRPTEDEVHYRRLTSGQWIDNPPPKRK